MKIVIAPDSFKESLTSYEVASELEAGLKRVWPDAEYVKVPMADGGEGTVQSLVDATGGRIVKCAVTGPLGQKVLASYGILGDGRTAVIEMAEASGLPLVPRAERDPMRATTYGTGELLADAIKRGAEDVIIGIGGSATNDGGVGFAQALGVRFLDERGALIEEPLGGGRLDEIYAIDMTHIHPGLANVTISVACDVTNPLTGDRGASAVYGPQKGATPEMVQKLDRNLGHLSALLKRDLHVDVAERPGAGAGGGIGAGLMAFTNATLKRGVELVVAATKLDEHMKGATLAITGEGRVDFQTAFGKTPSGVAAAAHRHEVPVVAIGGGLADDANGVFLHGIDAISSAVASPMPLDVAMEKARQYLRDAAERVARLIVVGQQIGAGKGAARSADAAVASVKLNGANPSEKATRAQKRNNPVKGPARAKKRAKNLTPAAVELAQRRRRRQRPSA